MAEPVSQDTVSAAVSSNVYMEQELRQRADELAKRLDADVLSYIGPIFSPFDDDIRDMVEQIDRRRKRLCVFLETEGGSIETTVNRPGFTGGSNS